MAQAADHRAKLKRRPPAARLLGGGGAWHSHQQITEQLSHGMLGVARDARGDEGVAHVSEQRHLLAVVLEHRIGVPAAPLLVDGIAEPQILDPRAARAEDLSQDLGRGGVDLSQQAHQQVRPLLHRSAEVRRPDAGHVTELPGPGAVPAVVRGAARDQPAHAVADQRDRLDIPRIGRDEPVDQRGQLLTAVGDVTAAVVAQVERRVAEALAQLAAKAHSRLAPEPLGAVAPAALGQRQPVDEDDDPPRGLGEAFEAGLTFE